MAENDILAQQLLQQSRQQGRRQSVSSRLAEQMMAGLNNPTPVYSTGATLARAGSGLLAGLLAARADTQEQQREEEDFKRVAQYQDQVRTRDMNDLRALAGGAAQPAAAPPITMQPLSPPQDGGGSNLPRGYRNNNPLNITDAPFTREQPGYQGSDGRFGRFDTMDNGIAAADRLLQSYAGRGLNTPQAIINRWAPAGDGNNNPAAYATTVARALNVEPSAALDMNDPAVRRRLIDAMAVVENGRPMAPAGTQYAGRPTATDAGPASNAPPPSPGPASAPSGAPTAAYIAQVQALAAGGNAAATRLLPGLQWQYEQAQRRQTPNPTVEINGPQGPGTYERRPDGTLAFIGARMPPQEGPSSSRGPIPEGMRLNSAGTLEEIPGYRQRPQQPDETERLLRASGYTPGTPEYEAQARRLLERRGQPAQTNVNVSPETSLMRADSDTLKAINEGQGQARSLISLLDRTERAVRAVPEGQAARFLPAVGQTLASFGVQVPGTSEAEILNALTGQLAGLQRIPGSGATTDYEMRLFLQAVPRLGNTRDGNLALLDMGRRLARRRIEEAAIWRRHVGQPDLMERLDALPPVFGDSDMEVLMSGPAARAAPPPAPPRPPGMIDRARNRGNASGTPQLPPGFEVVQ